MKNVLNIFLIFVLIPFMVTRGQSVEKVVGYVIDESNGMPLIGANVVVLGTSQGASTDINGRFQISNLYNGEYSIIAQYVGYESIVKSVQIQMDRPVNIMFRLKPTVVKVDDIEIVAERAEQTSDRIIEVIRHEDIRRLGAKDVGDVLKTLNAVEIAETGGLGSKKTISIRGSNANQVLVLLDDVPLNDQMSGEVDLSQIPVDMIESIKVHKGGSSPAFGNGAIAGVVQIETRKVFKKYISLQMQTGSFQYQQFNPSFSGVYKNFGYYTSFGYTENKGDFEFSYEHGNETINAVQQNADFISRNYFSRFYYDLKDNRLTAHLQLFNSERGLPGQKRRWSICARSHNERNLYGFDFNRNKKVYAVTMSYRITDEETANVNLPPDTLSAAYKGNKYNYVYNVENKLFIAKVKYFPKNWIYLTIGFDKSHLSYNDEDFLDFISPIGHAKDKSHSFSSDHEIKFKQPKLLMQGQIHSYIRYDEFRLESKKTRRFEHQTSPGIGANLQFGNKYKVFLRGNFSRSFRIPTFADLFYQDGRVIGKHDLLPEKGKNKEFNCGFDIQWFGDWTSEYAVFQNKIDDLIYWTKQAHDTFTPANTDAQIDGYEYNLSYTSPNEWVIIDAGYTHLEPLNKSKNITLYDKIITFRPQDTFKGKIEWHIKSSYLILQYRHIGKRFTTITNTYAAPEYEVFDLTSGLTKNFHHFSSTCSFAVLNVFDEEYELVQNMSIPGRQWRVGLNFKF